MYKIRKVGSMHEVVCASTGIVQFSSLRRYNCVDWITAQREQELAG